MTTTQKPILAKPLAEKGQAEAKVFEASSSNAKNQKQGNFPTWLSVVYKQLGKSQNEHHQMPFKVPSCIAKDPLMLSEDRPIEVTNTSSVF